jgi:AcrR family transcriptional regulator
VPKVIDDDKIFTAVMKLVASRGYAGATTKEMAEAAEISEVSLFRKYGSKQELVRHAISAFTKKMKFNDPAQYSGNLENDLLRIVRGYSTIAQSNGIFFLALLSEIFRKPDLVEVFGEPMQIFTSIAAMLAAYQKEGKLKEGHPLHMTASLLAPLMYISMMRNVIPNALPEVDPLEHVQQFLEGHGIM